MATDEVDSMKTEPTIEDTKDDVEKEKRPENLCCYSQRECCLEKLKGFDFCHEHILEDKASLFKPCSFISKTNGKKCQNPAPNLSDREKTYCLIHTRDSELRKVVEERSKKRKRKRADLEELPESLVTKGTHPNQSNNGVKNTKKHKIIEGEDYKRDEMLRVKSSWHGDYESDTESLDNEFDDPLRHAGVWTAEEVTKVCRDKLLRLRSLYMAQFERLKHVFKNKRRKYLVATNANEEGDTSVVKKKEQLSAFDLATRSYNKRYRTEALLQKQSKDRRLGAAAKINNQILPHQRCTHYTDGNRCVSRIVPSTKFCLKHICHDPNQVLFLPCSQMLGKDERCGTAVPNVLVHDKCLLHLPHVNEMFGDNLKEKLQEAKQLQIIKEKEKEEKRKAALEERASMISAAQRIADSAVPSLKPKDEPGLLVSSSPTTSSSTNQPPDPTTPDTAQEYKPMFGSPPGKQPQSPTTNLQIRIRPSKKPEIIFTDVAPQRPQETTKQSIEGCALGSDPQKPQESTKQSIEGSVLGVDAQARQESTNHSTDGDVTRHAQEVSTKNSSDCSTLDGGPPVATKHSGDTKLDVACKDPEKETGRASKPGPGVGHAVKTLTTVGNTTVGSLAKECSNVEQGKPSSIATSKASDSTVDKGNESRADKGQLKSNP